MQYSVSPRVNLKQLGTEAEREREHAHADAPGHQEMAELVHENQHAEDENKGQNTGH